MRRKHNTFFIVHSKKLFDIASKIKGSKIFCKYIVIKVIIKTNYKLFFNNRTINMQKKTDHIVKDLKKH